MLSCISVISYLSHFLSSENSLASAFQVCVFPDLGGAEGQFAVLGNPHPEPRKWDLQSGVKGERLNCSKAG